MERRLEEEYERTIHCLSMTTEVKIRTIIETELIANNIKALMEVRIQKEKDAVYLTVVKMKNSGLESMLAAEKYEDLLRMYNLFSRVPAGLNEMRSFISKYILNLGSQINQRINSDLKMEKGSSQVAISWVQEVLGLQDRFDTLLDRAANKDKSFQTVFNEAFENFMNANSKSAEFISLFIDENLKKGLKGVKYNYILCKLLTFFMLEIRGRSR